MNIKIYIFICVLLLSTVILTPINGHTKFAETIRRTLVQTVIIKSKTNTAIEADKITIIIPASNIGAGVLIDNNGLILTNYHVVERSLGLSVIVFGDTIMYQADTVRTNKILDLAIIRIHKKLNDEQIVTLGKQSSIWIGDDIFIIGYPYGCAFTVTKGIISGIGRTSIISPYGIRPDGLLQIDAALNPGNSGGGLFNDEGELIGINTLKLSESEGLSFSIPISTVRKFLERE